MQLRALLVVTLVMVGIACTPPCEPVTSTVTALCHRADAGAIAPDASFILEGTPSNYGTDCAVSFSADGGTISLEVLGSPACGAGAGLRVAPSPVACVIPPLAAGTYTVNSDPAVTFTLPLTNQGIPACDR